jgi:hypothetical protein
MADQQPCLAREQGFFLWDLVAQLVGVVAPRDLAGRFGNDKGREMCMDLGPGLAAIYACNETA